MITAAMVRKLITNRAQIEEFETCWKVRTRNQKWIVSKGYPYYVRLWVTNRKDCISEFDAWVYLALELGCEVISCTDDENWRLVSLRTGDLLAVCSKETAKYIQCVF